MNPWLKSCRPNPAARVRLFCFPYAGGGASIYRTWPNEFPDEFHVCPMQLPGRESRMEEPAYTDVHTLAAALADGLEPYLDIPFAFFGHSMGALTAFELTRALRRSSSRLPIHLFLSAHRAPHIPLKKPPIHDAPNDRFMQELRRFQGTPEEVLNNAELMEILLPTLRADFALHETYVYSPEESLSLPLTVFGGTDDTDVRREELEEWRAHSTAPMNLKMFTGNHFFLHHFQREIIAVIVETLGIRKCVDSRSTACKTK